MKTDQEYTPDNPPKGHEYEGIVSKYQDIWFNSIGMPVDVKDGILVRRIKAPDKSYLFFRRK